MKITEIRDPILNALRDNKFVGDFTVTISHPRLQEDIEIAKITGFKRTEAEFPYDFSLKLQSAINEICFKIVSGLYSNEDFTFSIKGRIEYERTYDELCLYQKLAKKLEALEGARENYNDAR